jgi:uncharacterized protein YjbI with pentapeptide repeats
VADLTGAYLRGANVVRAYLSYADLTGAYLADADLTVADRRRQTRRRGTDRRALLRAGKALQRVPACPLDTASPGSARFTPIRRA